MSAEIDEKTVRHISHLARLNLSESQLGEFRRQLSRILEYVELLQELDTSAVEPTAHAIAVTNVFREDVPRETLGVDRVLHNAPARETPFFKVPKVLDQGGA